MIDLRGIIVVTDHGHEWIPAGGRASIILLTRLVIARYVQRVAVWIKGSPNDHPQH